MTLGSGCEQQLTDKQWFKMVKVVCFHIPSYHKMSIYMCELFNAVSFVLHDLAQLYTDEHSEHILDSLCILDIDPLLNKYMICNVSLTF